MKILIVLIMNPYFIYIVCIIMSSTWMQWKYVKYCKSLNWWYIFETFIDFQRILNIFKFNYRFVSQFHDDMFYLNVTPYVQPIDWINLERIFPNTYLKLKGSFEIFSFVICPHDINKKNSMWDWRPKYFIIFFYISNSAPMK